MCDIIERSCEQVASLDPCGLMVKPRGGQNSVFLESLAHLKFRTHISMFASTPSQHTSDHTSRCLHHPKLISNHSVIVKILWQSRLQSAKQANPSYSLLHKPQSSAAQQEKSSVRDEAFLQLQVGVEP